MNGAEAQYKDYTLEYEDIFNGPIFLLVELVQKKKIDIYDISLSYIINGFMEFIKEKSGVLLDTISSFTYFSSILLEIKSRSLLPSKKEDDGEEGELDVNILKRREEEYRIYKKVSNYISSKIIEESLFYIREAPLEKDFLDTFSEFTKKIELIGMLPKLNPNVSKVGGLQSQGVKGEAVVTLPRSLYNAGSEVLRLSRRVNNMLMMDHQGHCAGRSPRPIAAGVEPI